MEKRYSSIANNPVSFLNQPNKNVYSWLEAKKNDDNAEGLWRIHDSLYDLSNFVDRHPGGRDWLILTQGTDITEAFETHHLNETKLEPYLKKFYVREANKPRNIKLTFKPNGFYKSLKRRVVEKLPTLNKTSNTISKIYSDVLLFVTFALAIITMRYHSIGLAAVTGLFLTLTAVCAHNYFHQRDNFRMFYFNFCGLSFREWRISHALSHHLFPNSLQDLEVLFLDPWASWLPDPKLKGTIKRYISWIYTPLLWSFIYVQEFFNRIKGILSNEYKLHKDDFIPFSIPLAMYIFGDNSSISDILYMWVLMILSASLYFGIIGFNAGHHHPEVLHDGDAMRENLDWGLYSMDTIIDRHDLKGSTFLILTHFGHHTLHHLFPTLDHGLLHNFYPDLFETMAEHEGELRSFYWYHLIAGQFKQLARIEPMKESPLIREQRKIK